LLLSLNLSLKLQSKFILKNSKLVNGLID